MNLCILYIYIFIYSVYMSNPIFQFILPAASSPVTISLFSTSVTFCFVNKFSSVTQSCLTLCDPMDCSTPTPRACSNSCPLSL